MLPLHQSSVLIKMNKALKEKLIISQSRKPFRQKRCLVRSMGLEPITSHLRNCCRCLYGRRRGIRTPIQAPKASVLPLHYVLYIRNRIILFYGAEGGTRTHDFQIISLVPYQLGHPNILYLYYNIFF